MRLIDADKLLGLFVESGQKHGSEHGVKLGENWLLDYNDIRAVIEKAPTVNTTFREVVAYECGQKAVEERKEMYRELERLKRMDVHGMQCEKGDYIFEYHEVSDRQGITQFDKGVLVYHYSIAEPMSRQTFEEFCEEVVEKENNRGMDNKQSDKA